MKADLENLSLENVNGSKTVKDEAAATLPGILHIISVSVSTALSTTIKDLTDKLVSTSAETQRINMFHRFDSDRLEQYMRRDSLRILEIREDPDEDEDVLQAKVLEVADDMGVKIDANDISIAHRLGRAGERGRPVIVRFCHRKNRNAMLSKMKKNEK